LQRVPEPDENQVHEAWVEPMSTEENGHQYYFDLRAYVIDGRVEALIARRAAGPCSSAILVDSPLSWLTTAGPQRAVCCGRSCACRGVHLAAEQVDQICAIAERSVAVIGAAAESLDLEDVRAMSGTWSQVLDDKDRLAPVMLSVGEAP
jgi:hypothetical protein